MAIILSTDDTRREVFLKAEQAKIHTESILPELTNPAAAGDVIAGKEYIDGAGAKQEGTLVVCDTVQDDGYFGDNGYGLSVNLVSVLDRSTKILELPEPNLAAENIVQGKSIFGVSGTAKLPTLDNPASTGDVIAGKEYIDSNGGKKAGTLVVCDTIVEAEHFGVAGTGVSLDLESTADGSSKTMTLPEPNLQPENIKSGISIFDVLGSAKTMRVETGTITPAKDSDTMTIEISGSPKAVSVVAAQTHTPAQGDILGACYDVLPWRTVCGYNGAILYYGRGLPRLTQVNASVDAASIGFPKLSSSYFWRAGVEYTWTAYYWEDDA